MELLEQFVRRYAVRERRKNALVFVTTGDPLMMCAFAALGWMDGHPVDPASEAATVQDVERAVIPGGKKWHM